jgi:GNAT superfamily N-acetyltransferase
VSPPESIEIVEEPLDAAAGQRLVRDYVAEIRALYPDWTLDVPPRMTAEDVEPPGGRWVVAYRGGQPVGCAGLKPLGERAGEVKRVYVVPQARGTGVSRALLLRLEEIAKALGYARLRMDTGARQPASVALFRSMGYQPIGDYNGNPVAAYWFEKRLT